MGLIQCSKHGETGIVPVSHDLAQWVLDKKSVTKNDVQIFVHNLLDAKTDEVIWKWKHFVTINFLKSNNLEKVVNTLVEDIEDDEAFEDDIPSTGACCTECFKEFLDRNNISSLWEKYIRG